MCKIASSRIVLKSTTHPPNIPSNKNRRRIFYLLLNFWSQFFIVTANIIANFEFSEILPKGKRIMRNNKKWAPKTKFLPKGNALYIIIKSGLQKLGNSQTQ